jgi:phosphonate transport system permease protein
VLAVGSWFLGDFDFAYLTSDQVSENTARFAGKVVPKELRGEAFSWPAFTAWIDRVMHEKGWRAVGITLAISITAIVLAGLVGLLLAPFAARTVATPEPYLPAGRRPTRLARLGWRAVVAGTRLVLIFLRALPEYVWAFLLLTMFGPTAWPGVLALAIHNAGILGKLSAEVIENASPGPLASLRGLGASRAQILATGALPASFGRFLLYFFYRWETCVREATVLGMVGIVSLGYFIKTDAEVRQHYGEMILLILLGSALVILGDLLSAYARRVVRRA